MKQFHFIEKFLIVGIAFLFHETQINLGITHESKNILLTAEGNWL